MNCRCSGDTAQLLHGDVLIMEATPWTPDAVTTEAVSIEHAAAARSRFVPFLDDDISMTCFSAEFMQLHAVHGAHLGDGRYATDWTVPDWATSSLTSSAALWAALDCTAAFYVCGSDGERMAFTVQYAVDQRRAVAPGERVAIVGWTGDYEPVWDGRKRGARQQRLMKMAMSLRSQGHFGFRRLSETPHSAIGAAMRSTGEGSNVYDKRLF